MFLIIQMQTSNNIKRYFWKDHFCRVKVLTANIDCCNTITPVTGWRQLKSKGI